MAVEKVNEYDHLSFIDDAFKLAKEKAEATYDGKGKLKIKASVSCLLYDIVDNKSKVMLCRLNKEKAETEDPRMFDNMLAFTGGKPEKEDYGKELPICVNTLIRELLEEGNGVFDDIDLKTIMKDKEVLFCQNDNWEYFPAITFVLRVPNLEDYVNRFNKLENKNEEIREMVLVDGKNMYEKIKNHKKILKMSNDLLLKEGKKRTERCVVLDDKNTMVDYCARTILFGKNQNAFSFL